MDNCLVAVLDEVGKQSQDFGLQLQGYASTTEFLALPGRGIGTKGRHGGVIPPQASLPLRW